MGRFNSSSTLLITSQLLLLLLFFSVFTCDLRICSSQKLKSQNPFEETACALVNCGEGKCKGSHSSMLGFECECNPGWRKIQIGPFTFPSCLIPNCTIDFQCGNGTPSPPPPPQAPLILPSINSSNPCALAWCGDGNCVGNGNGHTCQCYQGSANLFNNLAFACFKQCHLGSDCNGLGLGLPTSPSTTPPTNSDFLANASYDMEPIQTSTPAASRPSSKLRATAMILLAATIGTWF